LLTFFVEERFKCLPDSEDHLLAAFSRPPTFSQVCQALIAIVNPN
jgi:hypothetical protein